MSLRSRSGRLHPCRLNQWYLTVQELFFDLDVPGLQLYGNIKIVQRLRS